MDGRSARKDPIAPNTWGWDYQDCKWRWKWTGFRLAPVERMINRAFASLGRDTNVMKQVWTRPVVLGGGKTVTETQYFSCDPGVDICCADTVGFCAYQTGVVDFLKGVWVHHVNTYHPAPGSKYFRRVGVYKPGTPKELIRKAMLPGDYFLYVRPSGGDPQTRIDAGDQGKKDINYADHINMVLGPYVEVASDGTELHHEGAGDVEFINGSLTTWGTSAFVLPMSLEQVLQWEFTTCGAWIVHGRFLAIERLYADAIGPPLRAPAKAGADTSGPPDPAADIDAFWSASAAAGAPYPVGSNLGWHQGVHVQDPGGKSDVLAIGPGTVVAARLAAGDPPLPEGDPCFVLVRHLLARDTKALVDPKELAESKKNVGVTPFFALYMHLSPITRYLGPQKDGDEVPPLAAGAPTWLEALWPRPTPRDTILAGTPQVVLVPKDGDGDAGWVALGTDPRLKLPSDVPTQGLKQVTDADGKLYWVMLQGAEAHLDAWTKKPTTVPAAGQLCYFNPVSGKILKLPHDAGKAGAHLVTDGPDGPGLEVHRVDEVDYARIDSFRRPGLSKVLSKKDVLTTGQDDQGNDMLVVPPKVAKLTLYLDTSGDDAAREFTKDGSESFDLALVVDAEAEAARLADRDADRATRTQLRVLDQAKTGKRDSKERIWVDLVPCVALAAGQKGELQKSLTDHETRLKKGAASRLGEATSRVAAVLASTEDGAEWKVDGLELTPNAEAHLYTTVGAKSGTLTVDTKPEGKGELDPWQLTPDALGSTKLHALQIVEQAKGPKLALTELRYGVEVQPAADALKQQQTDVKASNDKRIALAKDLLAGKVVDLRARLSQGDPHLPLPLALRVGREPIGTSGKIVESPGVAGDTGGIHIEIYAGKPLATPKDVDPATFPDKTITRVAGTPWLAFKDTATSDLLSGDLPRKLVTELLKQALGLGKGLDTFPPADDKTPWTPSRKEWLEFCSNNARLLSRLVTVHPSEWALDWPESASRADSIQKAQTDAIQGDVKRVHQSLAWAKDFAYTAKTADDEGDGVPDPSALVFHSPPRLVEYLRTGIQVELSGAPSIDVTKAKVTFTPDFGEAVPLGIALETHVFSARISVSESPASAPSVGGILQIDGIPKPLTFRAAVLRGATTRLHVVEPWLSASVEWRHAATGYAVDVKHATSTFSATELYFLGDGGGDVRGGYMRAHVTVTAFFNDKAPKLTASKGSAGFAIEGVDVQLPPAPAGGDPSREPQSATLTLDVAASPSGVAASGNLTVTASGGDFAPDQSVTIALKSRTIEKGMAGPDVAQLELVLANMMAADGFPCYRASASHEDVALDPDKRAAITIDGSYGNGLRHALWRFIYHFASSPRWHDATVTTSGGSVAAADVASFARTYPELLEHPERIAKLGKTATDEMKAAAARLLGAGDAKAEWPKVDAALLPLLKDAFGKGHAVPHADITLSPTGHVPASGASDAPPITVAVVKDRVARPLPLPDYGVLCMVKAASTDVAGVDPTEPVEITLTDKGPYTLSAGKTPSAVPSLQTTLGDVMTTSAFYVFPSSDASAQSKATTLLVRTKGEHPWSIARHQLVPPRDFTHPWGAGDAGQDAAFVQYWLSQAARNPANVAKAQAAAEKAAAKSGQPVVPAPARGYVPEPKKPDPKKPVDPAAAATPFTTAIDGVWSDGWVKALRDYANDWGLPFKSDALVKKLAGH